MCADGRKLCLRHLAVGSERLLLRDRTRERGTRLRRRGSLCVPLRAGGVECRGRGEAARLQFGLPLDEALCVSQQGFGPVDLRLGVGLGRFCTLDLRAGALDLRLGYQTLRADLFEVGTRGV